MKRGFWVSGLLAAGAAGSAAFASARWHRVSTDMAATLAELSRPSTPFEASDLDDVPEPAAHYFRTSLRIDRSPPAIVRIEHDGEFRMGETWKPFRSTEVIAIAPGFLWDARIRVAPLVDVYVRDSYIGGIGSMQAAVAALLPVVTQRGGELNPGALQRYLGEGTWLPALLLPRHGVRWAAIDSTRARASLADGATSVSLEFTFNEAGEVVSVYTPARMREVNGRYEPTPWSARSWNYAERCGMRIPLDAEVAWHLDDLLQPYWRGRITAIECGPVPPTR
ncbi:MAG TPA: DUF6544 family protein [Vicinamibacterales bacterium]|nr:DUF6544 family protein [Vicinamibacterales bacterium]